jgi:hypothetical protein
MIDVGQLEDHTCYNGFLDSSRVTRKAVKMAIVEGTSEEAGLVCLSVRW